MIDKSDSNFYFCIVRNKEKKKFQAIRFLYLLVYVFRTKR